MDKEAILKARSRAQGFRRKLTDKQVKQVVQAIVDGASYGAAGRLVGVKASSARYWFQRSAK